ncbi:MAG: hypothetical protein K6F26_03315 [Lachnospiraceae bacterium]|nr:hypothetical protein [Lachnospiraceae bacterium]
MKQFLERNQGLKSRVPFVVRFKDYSPEEMGQIVSLEADKRGFSVSENAKAKILAICEKAVQTQELGNGRFCRNLVENAILEFASRKFGKTKEEAGTMNVKCELEPGDFVTNQLLDKKNKKTEIGFRG